MTRAALVSTLCCLAVSLCLWALLIMAVKAVLR